MNMSYCRFENTKRDLADCEEAFNRLLCGAGDSLSESEADAAVTLVENCASIVATAAETIARNEQDSELAAAIDTLNDLLKRKRIEKLIRESNKAEESEGD